MDMCGLSRCALKIICRLSRVGNKSGTSKKYQKCLERGIAQTRKLSTSAHGSDSCCSATTCLSVSVSGCVYLCVRTYATVCLPSHTAVWSVCDPQCHAQKIVSRWAHKKKKKKSQKSNTCSAHVSTSEGRQKQTRLPKCHHSFLWSTHELQLQAVRQILGLSG